MGIQYSKKSPESSVTTEKTPEPNVKIEKTSEPRVQPEVIEVQDYEELEPSNSQVLPKYTQFFTQEQLVQRDDIYQFNVQKKEKCLTQGIEMTTPEELDNIMYNRLVSDIYYRNKLRNNTRELVELLTHLVCYNQLKFITAVITVLKSTEIINKIISENFCYAHIKEIRKTLHEHQVTQLEFIFRLTNLLCKMCYTTRETVLYVNEVVDNKYIDQSIKSKVILACMTLQESVFMELFSNLRHCKDTVLLNVFKEESAIHKDIYSRIQSTLINDAKDNNLLSVISGFHFILLNEMSLKKIMHDNVNLERDDDNRYTFPKYIKSILTLGVEDQEFKSLIESNAKLQNLLRNNTDTNKIISDIFKNQYRITAPAYE